MIMTQNSKPCKHAPRDNAGNKILWMSQDIVVDKNLWNIDHDNARKLIPVMISTASVRKRVARGIWIKQVKAVKI